MSTEPAGDPCPTFVTWDCECGRAVGGDELACPYCGKDRPLAAEPARFFVVPAAVNGWDCPDCGRQHIKEVGTCSCGFMATRYDEAS